jgi:hypothetical protein
MMDPHKRTTGINLERRGTIANGSALFLTAMKSTDTTKNLTTRDKFNFSSSPKLHGGASSTIKPSHPPMSPSMYDDKFSV